MSQTQALQVFDHHSKTNRSHRRESDFGLSQKKKQRNIKNGRKRSKSFTGGGFKGLRPVLPTRFLLGGNIRDPLNLNSLQDEEVNRAMNAVTPKSSPIPTPPQRKGQVEVIIPPNINDPLSLELADDAEYEQQLCSPVKKCRKKRIRKKRTFSGTSEVADADSSGTTEAKTPETNQDSAKIPEVQEPKSLSLELKKEKKRKPEDHKDTFKKLKHYMDKIVSPVVPQPGAWFKRNNSRRDLHHRGIKISHNTEENKKMPEFKEKNKQFQYGNYNRYYGYRNGHSEVDLRLLCFSNHRELFENKDILDIGCNIGHITLSIARDFGARSIVGIDIDKKLIEIARKNIKHYVKSSETPPHSIEESAIEHKKSSEFFPISMPILYGPIEIPGFTKESTSLKFPNNVTFKYGNYILDDDSLLSVEQPQFDAILCLSVTKWIHLNWGDNGLKQAFRRMFAQLRPGGKLILEPQNWASYKTKRKLTETIFKNYSTLQFFPENFTQYLLSNEVGFAKSEILAFPQHQSRGFQRPVQVFTKSVVSSSERSENSNFSVQRATPIYLQPYNNVSSCDCMPGSGETSSNENCLNDKNVINSGETRNTEEN